MMASTFLAISDWILLACLAAYCDYRPIVFAAVAVALHHLTLNFLLPAAVYPGGSDFGRVVLHAVIVVFESAILIWLPYKLSKMFDLMVENTAEAETAANEVAQKKAALAADQAALALDSLQLFAWKIDSRLAASPRSIVLRSAPARESTTDSCRRTSGASWSKAEWPLPRLPRSEGRPTHRCRS